MKWIEMKRIEMKKKVLPGIEPGSLDSKSSVLTDYTTEPPLSMTGFEPATFRLEVWRAIQLRHTD